MSIRWGYLVSAATAVFASALVGRSSSAQTNGTPIRLEYDAAESCPGPDAFVSRLRTRTGHFELAAVEPQATTYRVTLRSGGESTGRVERREPSGEPIVQELHGRTCDEVADALALVIALAIDARTVDANPRTAGPSPPPTVPSPAPTHREVPSYRAAGPMFAASTSAISSTVGVGVSGPFVGPEAFLEAVLAPATGNRGISLVLDARLGASFNWSMARDSFGDVAQFTRVSAVLDLCPLRLVSGRLVASACARGEAGALRASGGSLDTSRPALAAGALVVARWTLWNPVFVQLEGGVVVPFVRDRFLLDGIVVYAVSRADALGAVAVGARFR